MQRNLKLSISWTVVTAILFVVYLIILSHFDKIPDEKSLVIWTNHWTIPLPFTISYWWSIAVFPFMLVLICYMYSKEELCGKYPKSSNPEIKDKYDTRAVTHFTDMISIIAGMAFFFFGQVLYPITGNEHSVGLISNIATGVFVFIITYIGLGIWMTALTVLMKEWESIFKERTLMTYYHSMLVGFIKIGFFRTLPLITGLTIGFLILFVDSTISRTIKGIRNSFKEKDDDLVTL